MAKSMRPIIVRNKTKQGRPKIYELHDKIDTLQKECERANRCERAYIDFLKGHDLLDEFIEWIVQGNMK